MELKKLVHHKLSIKISYCDEDDDSDDDDSLNFWFDLFYLVLLSI